ncbi:MAG: hypothetical protein LBG12_04870 [Synergistaceae bacterium]|jgi:hypothetical protein|nr:hypothetical protein [Synergistaceae bacterium]
MRKKNKKINQGQVIIPTGQPKPPEPHEVDAAWILARHYSCTVVFLIPVDDYKRKTPDIVMQGLEWEIKSPTGNSKNTIDRQLKRAVKQSKNLVFDGRRTALSDSDIEKIVALEMTKRGSIRKVIFITKLGGVVEIEPEE